MYGNAYVRYEILTFLREKPNTGHDVLRRLTGYRGITREQVWVELGLMLSEDVLSMRGRKLVIA